MRAQFVRGADPKDTMNIGNKHAREGQKLIAALKEIDPNSNPSITDDKTQESFEMVIASIKRGFDTYSLAWVNSGLEYYIGCWGKVGNDEVGGQDTFPKLEQAKKFVQKNY
jgi:hypothetical protein